MLESETTLAIVMPSADATEATLVKLEDDAVEMVVEQHALRLREEGLMLPAAAAAAAAAAVAGAKM